MRYASNFVISAGLTALNATITGDIDIPINGSYLNGIVVREFTMKAEFTDSSAGNARYNANECVYIRPKQISNVDTQAYPVYFLAHDSGAKCQGMQLYTIASGGIQVLRFGYEVSGGHIAQQTGITPAAGDTVSMVLTIGYCSE